MQYLNHIHHWTQNLVSKPLTFMTIGSTRIPMEITFENPALAILPRVTCSHYMAKFTMLSTASCITCTQAILKFLLLSATYDFSCAHMTSVMLQQQ